MAEMSQPFFIGGLFTVCAISPKEARWCDWRPGRHWGSGAGRRTNGRASEGDCGPSWRRSRQAGRPERAGNEISDELRSSRMYVWAQDGKARVWMALD